MAMHTIRRLPGNLLFLALCLLFSLPSCKKDTTDQPEDEFPVLGTCKAVTPSAGLVIENDSFLYRTTGGGRIKFSTIRNQSTDGWYITLGHDDYQNFKIELWGGKEVNSEPVFSLQHENLNGKHIKDRVGKTRTVIFPDGAKLTLAAESEDGRMLEISIYDNGVIHHYNPTCRTLELSVKNAEYADHFDLKQADGEASAIEFTDTGLIWINVYREDTPGNKVDKRELLGEIDRAYPNRVNDFFDDPRMGHT